MSTLTELVALRATAATDYATALSNFKSAYVALAALDRVLANSSVGYTGSKPSFGPLPDVIALRHPLAAPTVAGDWNEAINVAVNVHMAAFGTSDEE